ncbi:MAG: ATP-binding protein [Bacteroidales bacterium]|nr:ATP-binding protein [Bacteroidales bacterium]MDD4257398.1 ATP-binding protein [Bacteroidales bacterium]MDD4654046.1 ATP-binding protein [Bacteroidales bacterium]MDD4827914.1 ATP-binding protein [Bacteroidales bacterium]
MYIQRYLEPGITKALLNFPITAITGPRQCGKSTLVKHLLNAYPENIYLDLERPSDLQKLEDAEWFLASQKDKLICIDEVQRRPELFPLIRSLVDEWNKPGCFLILGSASRDLLKQSSESLAGRITYKRLTPFLWDELKNDCSVERYFSAGAFPRSLLSKDNEVSFDWRESFIMTFLERDLLQWTGFTPTTMRRLWQMLAHVNGQTVNYSTLASSLGVTSATVKNYIDLLADTYMVEVVPPYISNLGKRLVKAPKVYISDSGITATLLGLRSFEELSGHPAFGSIWEQVVLSNLKGLYPQADFFYYRTTNGAEIDFVMKIHGSVFAIECKASYSPSLSKGNYLAIEDIASIHTFVVTPSRDSWSMKENIDVVSLGELKNKIDKLL